MKKILLGVTKQGHEDRAEIVTSSTRKLTGSLWIVLTLAAGAWLAHALELIPLMPWSSPQPPTALLRSVGHIDSPNYGSSGFMVDERHFLTTRTAVNYNAKLGDAVTIRFQEDFGQLGEAVPGKVKWVSGDKDGMFLVIVELAESRVDYATISQEPFDSTERCAVIGFTIDSTGESQLKTDFTKITSEVGFLQADWGDKEPPLYEGFPIANTADFSIKGVLSEGIGVVDISVDELIEAGVRQ